VRGDRLSANPVGGLAGALASALDCAAGVARGRQPCCNARFLAVAKFAFSTERKLFIHARNSASLRGMYLVAIFTPPRSSSRWKRLFLPMPRCQMNRYPSSMDRDSLCWVCRLPALSPLSKRGLVRGERAKGVAGLVDSATPPRQIHETCAQYQQGSRLRYNLQPK